MIGKTVSHYHVGEKLGAGGMGEVYRARDTRLGREVALKVLPEGLAADPERMARFEREAQLLASLNHPNIAVIHGLEEADGVRCLVLELVEGETLAERLARGPLPLEEALGISRQIAEALEAAHERGVIHRDLKPGNVIVTPAGTVKVLDFGLAKAFEGEVAEEDISRSPTFTAMATQAGIILGTAAYMSPEQARGKPVDKRADVWSFGCVLFEMLTGKQLFSGETVSDTLASVLKTEPNWDALPALTPAPVRRLLRRCLEKDSRRRLRDIADARLEIEEALSEPAPGATPAATLPAPAIAASWRRLLPWALVFLFAFSTAVATWQLRREGNRPPRPITRFTLALAAGESLAQVDYPAVAYSPDGARLAYVLASGGTRKLYLRALDRLEATAVPGSDDATSPFFSPDGQWVAFFAEGKLKKVSVEGGSPITLCEAPDNRGGSWSSDDVIYFAPTFTVGLSRVAAAGGAPEVVTTPDAAQDERTHRWPEVLPGGKAALITIGSLRSPDYYLEAKIAVVSLDTRQKKILPIQGTYARYASSGHLLYVTPAGLFAVPFDLKRLEITGAPVPALEGVSAEAGTGAAQFALSRSGSLVYVSGGTRARENLLAWVDRKGVSQPLPAPPGPYQEPRLSPEGKRAALSNVGGRNLDIWVYDFARNTLTRLTFEGSNWAPLWTPDGQRISFASERAGPAAAEFGIFWKAADGSGPDERLTSSARVQVPESWSPDGKFLAFTEVDPKSQSDIWILPSEGDRQPRALLKTDFDEYSPVFSPDGRWLAYVSAESGRPEVYVRSFPEPGGKWQISPSGGDFPLWARNGRELFYYSGSRLMAVPVTTQPTFSAGSAQALLDGRAGVQGPFTAALYDVAPDARRFLMTQPREGDASQTQLTVVLDWSEELKGQTAAAIR